jgi:UDP-N-acetylglucosamine 2-epimerase (non-hydrolysing)
VSSKANNPRLNFIVGTAAELIKLYPVIRAAMNRGDQVKVVSTGQAHGNFMMQYREFGLPMEILDYLVPSEGDLKRTAEALRWFLRALFVSRKRARAKMLTGERAVAVVHGDTLSTLIGAVIARRLGLPVAHIEAGLRSPRLLNPFPEEVTRRWVSRLADYHFAPSAEAEANLIRARVKGLVVNTHGNTLVDAVRLVTGGPFEIPTGPYAICNVHRFENLNSPERWKISIETALMAASKLKIIFILHPQTRHRLENDHENMKALEKSGVVLRDRLSFTAFLTLLKGAEFLISDGGSNQEECSYLGKPCLLMREATERHEGLDGPCVLSRFDRKVIKDFIENWRHYRAPTPKESASPSLIILEALS